VRRHFKEVYVVTSTVDAGDVMPIAAANDALVVVTDAFYEGGARFNKFRALEFGLDVMGRYGVLCVMDADVIWPRELPRYDYRHGKLYTPLRRMAPWPLDPIPAESEWWQYPIHRNVAEWAGYSQIFHADDPHLGPAPWHDTGWSHAGGGDSYFQMKWPPLDKVRPPWECLHLSEAGVNWLGRATPLADGTLPEGAAERRACLCDLIRRRTCGPERFDAEKIK
jgi:hypothetical protein